MEVEKTNITSKDVVGNAVDKMDPTYTATTANFSVGLTQPGDSITYDIEVTNSGILDAVVESWFTSNSRSCFINVSGDFFTCGGAGFTYVTATSRGYMKPYAVGVYCNLIDSGSSSCSR